MYLLYMCNSKEVLNICVPCILKVYTNHVVLQVVSSAIKPQFVTTNAQFISTLGPKLAMAPVVAPSTISPASVVTTTTCSSKLVPSTLEQQQSQQQQQQPPPSHFVIQAPRTPGGSTATIVPVSVGGPYVVRKVQFMVRAYLFVCTFVLFQ